MSITVQQHTFLTHPVCNTELSMGWADPWVQLGQVEIFTARSSYASAVLGIVILSLCLSSVTHVLCDETKEHTANILIRYERVINLVHFSVEWIGQLGRSAKGSIFFIRIIFNWHKLFQVHDILTVVHKITHWMSELTHSRYCRIYLPDMDITGKSVGLGSNFSICDGSSWVTRLKGWFGSWKMDPCNTRLKCHTWTMISRMTPVVNLSPAREYSFSLSLSEPCGARWRTRDNGSTQRPSSGTMWSCCSDNKMPISLRALRYESQMCFRGSLFHFWYSI